VNRRTDGSPYETEASITPLRDETGAVTSFIEVRRDVSEQQELSRQLARAQKLESLGQLASGIAHEINTPTQYVGDNVRFLKEAFADVARLLDVLDIESASEPGAADCVLSAAAVVAREIDLGFLVAEMPAAFDQAIDGVGRIATIVAAMKDFSHPSQEKTACDLNALIHSTVTVTKHEWKYVADVELDLDPALPAMRAIGVRALARHLAGEIDLDEAVRIAQRETRNYAKRQLTWLRHQMPAFDQVDDAAGAVASALTFADHEDT
jgi:signal transduction histidine kinase